MYLRDWRVNHPYSGIDQEENGYSKSDFLLHSTVLCCYRLLKVNLVDTLGMSPCARRYRVHAETDVNGDLWITLQLNFENERNAIKASRLTAYCHQTRSMIDQYTKLSNPEGVE